MHGYNLYKGEVEDQPHTVIDIPDIVGEEIATPYGDFNFGNEIFHRFALSVSHWDLLSSFAQIEIINTLYIFNACKGGMISLAHVLMMLLSFYFTNITYFNHYFG